MPPPTEEEEDHDVYRGEDEDDEDEEDIETDDDDDDEEEEDDDLEEEEEEDLNYDSPSTSSEIPNINKIDSSASASASAAVAVAATTTPTPTILLPPSETLPTTTTTTTTSPIITIATPISASVPTTTTTTTIDISTVQNGSQVVTPSPASTVVVSELFPDHKRQRINEPSSSSAATRTTTITPEEKEKKPSAIDDSRRLFQRLWTDEDEIGLLQGFLDYTIQRGHKNSSHHHHHHDTAPFYDQIKNRLQLDFNKNQLVEKLRRLKKKYRNVMARINTGKDFNFKSPHDQATFEISRKIWSDASVGVGEAGIEDEEQQQNVDTTNNNNNNHGGFVNNGTTTTTTDATTPEKKVPRSRKRSRKTEPEPNLPNPSTLSNIPVALSIPNVIEDTVRSCLSPLLKELLHSVVNNGSGNARVLGGMALNPLPLHFGGNSSLNLLSGEMVDEKWRKQQILELEVYSKRMELVQDQIKLALEELRSKGSSSSS